MKKTLLTAAALALLTLPNMVHAADDSFYLNAHLGVGMAMDSDIETDQYFDRTLKMTFDTGVAAAFAAGYDFSGPMRVELEFGLQKNDLDLNPYNQINFGNNDGDLKKRSLMVNGYYDVDTGSAWTPYAGIGLGWANLDINNPGFADSDSDDVFSYQFIAGIAYAFNEQWSVDGQYRFQGTTDATINNADFDVDSNTLMVGLRYSF